MQQTALAANAPGMHPCLKARAQASTEFLMAMGAVLIVALTAAALSTAWPDVLFFTQQQRADQYWSNAHPFSVTFNSMKPDSMVMQLQNNDPTTLTISAIWLEGVRLDFYNHTIPFSTTAYARCSAGICNMTMAPGNSQIISTANFTTSPANPCGYGADFKYGARYEMALVISYYGKNSSAAYNQTATSKLTGTCSGYGGCMNANCCGDENQLCCTPDTCNVGSLVCNGGLCVPCGDVSQPCCSGSTCPAGNLNCVAGTCQCGNTGLYCCNGTTCTNASNICNATTTACIACGNTALPCCTGNSCSNASNMCNTTSQVCRRCGTAAGDLCCSGDACTLGANLTCNQSATPQHTCLHCGNSGEICCPPSNCATGYACNNSVCYISCTADAQSSCVCGSGNPLCNSTQYCALTIAPTSTCRSACANGSISSTCKCGSGGSYGGLYSSGYCCNGNYSAVACCNASGWDQNCYCGGTAVSGSQWCYNGNNVVSGTCTNNAYPVSPNPCKCGSTYATSGCCQSSTYYSGNCPLPYCASNNYMGACQFCGQVEVNCPADTYCEISSHNCLGICSPGGNGCYCTSLGYFSWWFGPSGCPG